LLLALGTLAGCARPHSPIPTTPPPPATLISDDAFLDELQRRAFNYFWLETNPANGLVRDRSRPTSFCSIAATGFGLTALGIGIDHGWITREQGATRTLATLKTFWNSPQGTNASGVIGHRGWFYHFLDMDTAARYRKTELSSIDTALFLAGALYSREYFNRAAPVEKEIRRLATDIFNRVEWHWMATGTNTLSLGWHPESGFLASRWRGYNEAMILYLLALGAENNPLPPEHWRAWTSTYQWETHYGHSQVIFPPLFGHQYSHCWVDLRGMADDYLRGQGIDYFENSRRATLAQRAYAIANPKNFRGYGSNVWGLTACDGPGTNGLRAYSARGAPPIEYDDGTIAPTAAGASMVFTPKESLAALRYFHDEFGAKLWGEYGFRDAFNLQENWWATDVLGIDQGPILLMIENHRTGSVWKSFMQAPEIKRGLQRAGFQSLKKSP
jgi:hypothetical protein